MGLDSSPEGCWRILYKYPVNKRTGDLQWRIVHGAVATNRYVVHLNPSVGVDWVGCPFCTEAESMFHLFVQCLRLGDLLSLLSNWFLCLG